MKKKSNSKRLLAGIVIVYLLNGIYYLRNQSITFDEGSFIAYAARFVHGHPERIDEMDNSKMPVSVLNLIPRFIQQIFHPGLKKTDNGDSDILSGRYVTLFISVCTILLIFRWGRELFGEKAGLFSAFLFSICPNNMASAGLVTTDAYSVLFLTLVLYALSKFCKIPNGKHLILVAVLTAVSQLVKQSLFHLYIILPVILIIWQFGVGFALTRKKILSYILIFLMIQGFVINAGFYFRDANQLLGNYSFTSHTFLVLQNILPFRTPVPLPKAFITGLDLCKHFEEAGGGNWATNTYGNITILGHSSHYGLWYYYIITLFYKTPISFLIFFMVAFLMVLRQGSLTSFLWQELFLLTPVVYFLLYLSLFYNTQIGIRHILFIFPFLFILSGRIMQNLDTRNSMVLVAALSLFAVVSVFRYIGNYYPYTNEFILDKKMAYRFVGAANLEYGQGRLFFRDYLAEHPEVHIATEKPAAGIFLINANDYLDVWNQHRYDWLRNIPPSGQVAYNGLLIEVK